MRTRVAKTGNSLQEDALKSVCRELPPVPLAACGVRVYRLRMNRGGRRAKTWRSGAHLLNALQNRSGRRFRESYDGPTKGCSMPGQPTQGV